MNTTTNYVSKPEYPQRRADDHGLRCNFRRLVNAGLVRNDEYADFILRVDSLGLVETVQKYIDRVR